MPEATRSVWRRAGAIALALIAGVVPVPVAAILAIADAPPGLANPDLHLRLRAVLVLWLYVTLGALFGFLSPGRSWRWGLWISVPLGAFLAAATVLVGALRGRPMLLVGPAALAAIVATLFAVVVVSTTAASIGSVLGRDPSARLPRFLILAGILLAVLIGTGAALF